MKKFAITTLIFCATSLTALAASIDGKWTSERKMGERTITSTFNLKSDGGALTGTIEMFRAYSDAHRGRVWIIAGLLILTIAWADWQFLQNISIGFLYIVPILLVSGTLGNLPIVALSAVCGVLREMFNPFNTESGAVA